MEKKEVHGKKRNSDEVLQGASLIAVFRPPTPAAEQDVRGPARALVKLRLAVQPTGSNQQKRWDGGKHETACMCMLFLE